MSPLVFLSLLALFLFHAVALAPRVPDPGQPSQAPFPPAPTRVPIVLGVMSRCPDALLCESVFDGVLKQTWDIVDISLSFIGELDDSAAPYGVACMHGPQECRGNVQELCAMELAHAPEDWWHFVQCLNYEGHGEVGDAALAQRCAGVAYVPWEDEPARQGLKSCSDSPHGAELLRASVARSQELGIDCTIMISGKKRCVHDGMWKECQTGHTVDDFVNFIQSEYRRLNNFAQDT